MNKVKELWNKIPKLDTVVAIIYLVVAYQVVLIGIEREDQRMDWVTEHYQPGGDF